MNVAHDENWADIQEIRTYLMNDINEAGLIRDSSEDQEVK